MWGSPACTAIGTFTILSGPVQLPLQPLMHCRSSQYALISLQTPLHAKTVADAFLKSSRLLSLVNDHRTGFPGNPATVLQGGQ